MRLVIDLQGCQRAAATDVSRSLALIKHIIRTAGSHEVWLVLNSQFGEQIGSLRYMFAELLPAHRIATFFTPALNGGTDLSFRRSAAALTRDRFLNDLGADVVFVPNALAADVVCASSTIQGNLRSVFTVAEADVLAVPTANDESASIAYANQQALLGGTAEVIVTPAESVAGNVAEEAQRAWDAFCAALASRVVSADPTRPRLAYVSPLPPAKSGISDYSAELIPELARYYDIVVIAEQETLSSARISEHFPVRDSAWLEEHAAEFERVLYHVGNSALHKHMFDLIEHVPGVVVLHDFYLGHALGFMDHSGYRQGLALQALYQSHGWSAVADRQGIGESEALWKYPCNRLVLEHAEGIIVHSEFSRKLAEQWYGPGCADSWRNLPLLRGDIIHANRTEARASLALSSDDFVVCAFGMLGVTKQNEELLDAWLASPLAHNPQCRLVFVGENPTSTYGQALTNKIARSAARDRIAITGFVPLAQYHTWLAACDVAVQLRSRSRGETSASVLDCLLHGVATITNAHGANAELPDAVLIKLDDLFTVPELTAALTRLWQTPDLRKQLGAAARNYVLANHAPAHVGALYHEAIEQFAGTSPQRGYRQLIGALGALSSDFLPTQADLADVATAIASNALRPLSRQLLVDISALVQKDLKSGIQRVVRSTLSALIANPPAGFRIEPVYSYGSGEPYRYARHFMRHAFGLHVPAAVDAPIEIGRNDCFLGLDLFIHGVHQNQALLQDFRNRGMAIYFVVYDALPVLRPDCFPAGMDADFGRWLETVGAVADGLLCISRAVADEVAAWYSRHPVARHAPLGIGFFHLGADISASAPTSGLPKKTEKLLAELKTNPTLLAVGTIEPRKGYAQMLDAFELLWQEGREINLVIVGAKGWMIDALAKRLQTHPEQGKRLFWLQGISDEMLMRLYDTATALLAASEGEGYGLPLVEAAQHNLPIIARNLPVFREVMGEHAYYFDGMSAQALASTVCEWLQLKEEGSAPASGGQRWQTWAESTAQLVDTIDTQRWTHVIGASSGSC